MQHYSLSLPFKKILTAFVKVGYCGIEDCVLKQIHTVDWRDEKDTYM